MDTVHLCLTSGSPPRVQGKVIQLPFCNGASGITPACAGKRSPYASRKIVSRDHPRVCGEKLLSLNGSAQSIGSSPHVRGKGLIAILNESFIGITPAYAGKRGRCCPDRLRCWDHPCMCGEKLSLTLY